MPSVCPHLSQGLGSWLIGTRTCGVDILWLESQLHNYQKDAKREQSERNDPQTNRKKAQKKAQRDAKRLQRDEKHPQRDAQWRDAKRLQRCKMTKKVMQNDNKETQNDCKVMQNCHKESFLNLPHVTFTQLLVKISKCNPPDRCLCCFYTFSSLFSPVYRGSITNNVVMYVWQPHTQLGHSVSV